MIDTSRLIIDLDAVAANYKALHQLSGENTLTGATVKANGYGLGIGAVSLACYHAGCRTFFVARLAEAFELREIFVKNAINDAEIVIFEGITHPDAADYLHHNFLPVINSAADLEQLYQWGEIAPAFFLHIDTAMNRLGLQMETAEAQAHYLSRHPRLKAVMSHLACADTPKHPLNQIQQDKFKKLIGLFDTGCVFSLANSAGIFLDKDFHFNLTRPGIGLSGTSPDDNQLGRAYLQPALTWQADILQIKTIQKGDTIGYGADFIAPDRMRIATIGAGYADGYPRILSTLHDNKARVQIGHTAVGLAGRVSMDTLVVDVTNVPEAVLQTETVATLIGTHYSISEMAKDCNTIGYELLTGLGARSNRQYNCTDKVLAQTNLR